MKPLHSNTLTFSELDGTSSLKKAVGMKRAEVLTEIQKSGLRGRGGAGFPTGTKWNLVAVSKTDEKFVVCNADEGEPGTFKDRYLLSHFSDVVLEGMTIGGYAMGAKEGIIFLRGEYRYLKADLEAKLKARRDANLLGENILGQEGFNFDIRIFMGVGAYICGEETALIEAVEGHRGEPRNRPPYPVDTGFKNKPTAVNNVETLAWASVILDKGSEWFAERGPDRSNGHKILSISGDCDKPGVYDVPFGITVSEMLQMVEGTGAKAVQVGGASGTCVPSSEFGRQISFNDVATGGSVIVFGKNRDLLDVAKNFMTFFVSESCGQCTPCRLGNKKLLDGIELLEKGQCSADYLNDLKLLGRAMQTSSKCGLGQSSPNAFLSILEHYHSEIMGRVPVRREF